MPSLQIVQPEAYTPEQAAVILGCGKTTLFRLLKEKQIDGRKLGRKTLILRSELERFLASLPREAA